MAHMKYQTKPGDDNRLAKILCLSLFVHMVILSALSWSHSGTSHAAHQGKITDNNRRFTVTLANALPAITQKGLNPVDEQPVMQASADVSTGENMAGDKLVPLNDGILPAVDSHFFTLAELDRRPVVVQDIADNPPDLLEYPQGGEVVLRLWIDNTGKVVNAEPLASGLPQAFVDSARASFLKAVFAPGRKLDNAVCSVMDVAIRYAPVPQYRARHG